MLKKALRIFALNDEPGNLNRLYGHLDVAARYCGMDPNPPPIRGSWPHGWLNPNYSFVTADGTEGDTNRLLFVWNERERDKGKRLGYHNPIIIGSPLIYLTDPDFSPDNRSLFLAPQHSHKAWDGITELDWGAYREQIEQWLPMFDHVLVCLHWKEFSEPRITSLFERLGCEVVLGAREHDPESLVRIHSYLQRCGFGSTNFMGTIVWYMAYAGCRVFVSGEAPRLVAPIEDSPDKWFTEQAHAIKDMEDYFQRQEELLESFPELPRTPDNAAKVVAAGIRELGYHYRRSAEELRRHFGWTPGRLARYQVALRFESLVGPLLRS